MSLAPTMAAKRAVDAEVDDGIGVQTGALGEPRSHPKPDQEGQATSTP